MGLLKVLSAPKRQRRLAWRSALPRPELPQHRVKRIRSIDGLTRRAQRQFQVIVTHPQTKRRLAFGAAGAFALYILAAAFLNLIPHRNTQAATSVAQGTFAKCTTSLCTNTITTGFQPKAIIFYWTRQTTSAFSIDQSIGYGFATSTTAERAVAIVEDDTNGTSNSGRRKSETSSIILLRNGNPVLDSEANVTAIGATSFDVQWTTNSSNAYVVHYIALGGEDITNAEIGTFNSNTTTGNQGVTGTGFKPDALMFLSGWTGANDTNLVDSELSLGFAKSLTSEAALVASSEDALASNANKMSQQRTDASILLTTANSNTQDGIADFTSMDSNGFTVNWSDAPAAATPIFYLALKGGSYHVGSLTEPAAAGLQATSTGFRPTGLMLFSRGQTASTALGNPAELAIGAAASSAARSNVWGEANNVDPADANMFHSADAALTIADSNSSAPVVRSQADLESFDAKGFTLDWSGSGLASRQVLYFAIGDTPGYEKITQNGYTFENDDEDQAAGDVVDEDTVQAGSSFTTGKTLTGVKKGERVTVRTQIKNTGTGALNSDLALFYDRNDGVFSKIEQGKPPTTAAGNCTDTKWDCTTVQDLAGNADHTSMAMDPAGNPWVAFRGGTGSTTGELVVANYVGSGGNCTSAAWNCTTVDDPAGTVGQYTSIAFDPAGNAWVSYTNTGSSHLKVAQYVGSGGSGCTSPAWTCTTVDSSGFGTYTSIAFDPAGNAWVSYTGFDGDFGNTLKVARYAGGSGGNCTSTAWTCTTVDDPANSVGQYTSIAFDPAGNAWVSYEDLTANSLKVARYIGSGGTGCTSTVWTCTTVDDPANSVGEYTSIAFDPSGNAWVSYYDSTAGSLKVAQYVGSGGSGCTSTAWTCTTVDDPANDVGLYISIAFDPAGNAWVSYHDTTADILKVAQYVGSGGTGCTSTAWTCTTVDDPANSVGEYTAIAFDPAGNAWLSYRDATAFALKVANIKRGGEIVLSPGVAGAGGDGINESHADMTSATDTTSRDDADCIGGGTWVNGKWFESEDGSGATMPKGDATAQCTEVAFTIDTSQAVAGRTYRIVIATDDNWRSDKGAWRGPISVATDAYPTLSIEADTTLRAAKDNQPKFDDCTDTAWGCNVVDDHASNNIGRYSSQAFDASGTSWISYWDGDAGSLKVARYVGSGGSGCTGGTNNAAWTCETVDDPSNTVGAFTSIAIDPAGRPWVSYIDCTTGGTGCTAELRLKVARYVGSGGSGCTGGTNDSAWICETVDDPADFVGFDTSIAFDPAGNAWVSYANCTNNSGCLSEIKLKAARYVGSGGSGCGGNSAWTCETVDDPANIVGVDTSLAFHPNGNAWIAYYDGTASALKVAHYVGTGGTGCGGNTAWTCETADDVANSGRRNHIAFDKDGNAWVSHRDANVNGLRVARYTPGTGASGGCSANWTCEKVDDPANNVGLNKATIAFDSDNKAWVAYDDATAKTLKIARYTSSGGSGCTNSTNAGAWSCGVVDDPSNSVGREPTIAFDHSGTPWVSYNDETANSLKVAKLHLPPKQLSQAATIANPGRSAVHGDARYRLDRGKAPATEAGCSATADNEGYCGIAADDSDFDSMSGTNDRPMYTFAKRHTSNSTAPTATWIGRSNIAPSTGGTTGDIVLQVYRFGTTNAWENITTNSSSSDCNTADCTVTGEPAGTASEYFEADGANHWAYFRVWQYENSSAETLKTDAFTVTFGIVNTAPNSPTSLAQKKTDDTVIATGGWTNETSVKFTASATDTDNPDTLQLCVEKDLLGTAFSNSEDLCGTGVAYSGTAVTVTVTITGITDASEYHWQARVKDAGGLYSGWVSYPTPTPNAETDRDFGVDTTAPTGGAVYDGTTPGVDKDFSDISLSQLSANWDGFDSGVSGLLRYDYSIGTTQGGTDTKGWTDNGTATSVTATGLTLQTSKVYYFNVRAVDNAGNTQAAVSSDGQVVEPDLSFTVAPVSATFANLNAANSYTDTKATTLTIGTNAFGGYVVRAFASQLLTGSGGQSIPNFDGGTYASPDSWQSGDTGFGYTSNDVLQAGNGGNKFQSDPCPGGNSLVAPGCYAPFSLTGPGDIVADNTNTDPAPYSDTKTITYRITTSPTQGATTYAAVIVYTVTATY